MLKHYHLIQSSTLSRDLAKLKQEYGGWGKLSFNDISGVHAALCAKLGEKSFKKILIAETSADFLVEADSALENDFLRAIDELALQHLYGSSATTIYELKDGEASDNNISHAIAIVPYADTTLSSADIVLGSSNTPTEIPVDKIPKKPMLSLALQWHSKIDNPDIREFFKRNKRLHLVTPEIFDALAGIFSSLNAECIHLKTKGEVSAWYRLQLEDLQPPASAEPVIELLRKNTTQHFLYDLPIDGLKQSEAFWLNANLVALPIADFKALIQAKLFSKSTKSWATAFGDWTVRLF